MDKEIKTYDKEKYLMLIPVITLILIAIGATYAFFQASASNSGTITGSGECYTVNYTKGNDISGEIEPVAEYTSGKSTDIVMYSDPNCASMTGTLYITTNNTSTMDFTDKALRYTVVVDGNVVSEGAVSGTTNQVIYSGFTLNTTSTTYTVYVWLDTSLEDTTNTSDESFSGFIHADAVVSSDKGTLLAYDLSGHGMNATINGATYTSDGLSFDGTDDYITLPDNLGVTFPATYSVTFKLNSTANQIIFGDYDSKVSLGLYNSNSFIISTCDAGSTPVYNAGTLSLNASYTVDLVYRTPTDVDVYLNGNKLSSTGATNCWTWNDTTNYIGKRGSGTYFNGSISRFIVYNDALTATEIANNLSVTNGLICNGGINCDNLALYYNFKSVKDLSGNNKNGTLYGAIFTSEGISFDGVDNYILLPSDIGATLPATYSVTFKLSSTANQIIFGDYDSKVSLGLYNSNSFIISTCDAGTTPVYSAGALSLNTSYTVDLVYRTLIDVDVYLNGNKLSSTGSNNCWTWNDTNNYIGKRGSGTYFNGVIESFIVYDEALTSTDITNYLSGQNGLVCDRGSGGLDCDKLKLYYKS